MFLLTVNQKIQQRHGPVIHVIRIAQSHNRMRSKIAKP